MLIRLRIGTKRQGVCNMCAKDFENQGGLGSRVSVFLLLLAELKTITDQCSKLLRSHDSIESQTALQISNLQYSVS